VPAASPPPTTTSSSGRPKQPPTPPAVARRLINLAAAADGASVLAANPEAKRPERAIDADVDSFMKNDCPARKWLMIELSQVRDPEGGRVVCLLLCWRGRTRG
jgi:hypothetical protein